ncbi:hypothetical protein K435DRAFT_418041 [Dendrothele bispora CBS 962.96]|uniref:SET domain-containing protein n=1 Tax=Dendrothele bispora (strain CBS 962.96) TaxID=1314807 RepID=A0A4V4HIL0_DENBC|nr:hypothetical protein K435DRAFT_418041 [Dendrothele bispora CBS 962.96]
MIAIAPQPQALFRSPAHALPYGMVGSTNRRPSARKRTSVGEQDSSRIHLEVHANTKSVPHHPKCEPSRSCYGHTSLDAALPSASASDNSSKKLRTASRSRRLGDAQVVYFSSPRNPSADCSSLGGTAEDAVVETLRFKDLGQECLICVRGLSAGSLRPEPSHHSDLIYSNDNVVILPVGGPDSGLLSPYTYSLDKPLRITVASGVLSGLGMFAKRSIPRGSVILAEKPVMIVEDANDAEHVFEKLERSVRVNVECLPDLTASHTHGQAPGMRSKTPQGIVKTNAFDIECASNLGEKKACKAIFLQSSRCNHSCGPSAIATFDASSLTLTLLANRNLKPGDEITISYLPVLSSSSLHPSVILPFSPPTSPPTTIGHLTPTFPSGTSVITESSSSPPTISSLLSSSSIPNSTNVPAIYLPRHSRRRLLSDVYNIDCRCEHCDIPWTEAASVHKSDRVRKELGLYNLVLSSDSLTKLRKKLAIPTFEEWCGDSRFSPDSLITVHSRLMEMREKEGLELTALADPRVSVGFQSGSNFDAQGEGNVNLKEEGWLKHADVIGMCFGALGDKKGFRRWVRKIRDVRWAMSMCGDGGSQEQIGHVKVLDTWLDRPETFPLWGWRAQKEGY